MQNYIIINFINVSMHLQALSRNNETSSSGAVKRELVLDRSDPVVSHKLDPSLVCIKKAGCEGYWKGERIIIKH